MYLLRLLWEYHQPLLSGLSITIGLSIVAMAAAAFFGLLLCVATMSAIKPIRLPAFLVVEFCRNTPILVQLIWVHFALPAIVDIRFSPLTSAFIALTMQSSGYLAEEYRAGIESIEKGQVEAALSLGMTKARMMRRIILPQAIIRMMPGILNQFVTCVKSTSIVSVIAVPDLMYQAGLVVSATFVAMPIWTFIALVYFFLVMAVSAMVRYASSHLPTMGRMVELHRA